MPELPEAEATLCGIKPHTGGKKIVKATTRQSELGWPIHPDLTRILAGHKVLVCNRHAKYLIITFEAGILLIHLDMSGSLQVSTVDDGRITTPDKHDHLDFVFDDSTALCYHDPYKFGVVLWYEGIAEHHPLSEKLGPEPLSEMFGANYLYQKLKMRERVVKLALIDSTMMVDVGNIYTSESLLKAGISPLRSADKLTEREYALLVETTKTVLLRTIKTGSSTLRGFVNNDGKSGYFQQEYIVYGHHDEPYVQYGGLTFRETLGRHGTFYCPNCQR